MTRYTFFALLLLSCGGAANEEAKTPTAESSEAVVVLTDTQLQTAGIRTGAIEARTITNRLQVNGLVDVPPQSMISVSVPLGGYLKSTRLLPGMRIRKGEVLAELEDPQYIQLQQDYLVALARLRVAEADYRRQEELRTTESVSEKILQQVRAEFETLRVQTKALAAKLELIHITPAQLQDGNIRPTVRVYAPINGFVSKVNVNIGKYVSPTDVLFELVDPSDIHLNLTVFEKDAAQLKIGQHVVAFSNHKPDEKHIADIFLISRNVNEDRAVQVHCHFDDYDPMLLPGMYMNALVEVQQQKVPALPDAAVVSWQNKRYVFTEKAKNNYEMREVQVTGSTDGFTAVVPVGAPFAPDARFVTVNAYALLMKLKNSAEEE